MSFAQTLALIGSLAASVSAHGHVKGIVASGTYYQGYSPLFQYSNPPPTVAGWSDPEDLNNGFIAPAGYADPDIICHLDATPGGTSLKVAGGDTVELQWTAWPESHHGPVIDYLAKCTGECTDVDKTTLEFFKISQSGLIDWSASPGKWASDDLIANNNSWSVTIPTGIASGNYVLRHEIIALHSAGDANGAQNYPQCINLEITSDGIDAPSGTLGTALYKEDDPGVLINIYTPLATYTIPGPSIYSGAASAPSQTEAPITSDAPALTGSSTSYVEASTTAVATSAAASSSASSSSAEAVETSAPSTTAAPASAPTTSEATADVTVTSECTTTIYATITEYDEDPAYATATAKATGAPDSAIASIIDAVPSEALTSTIPTTIVTSAAATPTGYVPSNSGTKWGSKPPKPLPAGWTLKDLLQWVSYLAKQSWNGKEDDEEKKNHSRDFRANELPYKLREFERGNVLLLETVWEA